MPKKKKELYYSEYLCLDKLLDAQHPESRQAQNQEAHDETLFIIVHQAYELWFKQIIHEFKSIMDAFSKRTVDENNVVDCVYKLERIKKIQNLLIDQIDILETMNPMDFLEFRDLLVPASGFQSIQFKKIEAIMGIKFADRSKAEREYFLHRLNKKDRSTLTELDNKPSLFEHIERWLGRLPFTETTQFNFWEEYQKSVSKVLDRDKQMISSNTADLNEEEKKARLSDLASTRHSFEVLFDKEKFSELKNQGTKRLSQKATLNALFIFLFRFEPILAWPYKFLTSIMDVDENFTTWRHRHALMVQRMIGTRIGTGGSSGYKYLKKTAEQNRIYEDIFDLSTFIIRQEDLPDIPRQTQSTMGFHSVNRHREG